MPPRRIPLDLVVQERTRCGLLTAREVHQLDIVLEDTVARRVGPGSVGRYGVVIDGQPHIVDVPLDLPPGAKVTARIIMDTDRPELDRAAARVLLADTERRARVDPAGQISGATVEDA